MQTVYDMAARIDVSIEQYVKFPRKEAFERLCDWESHSKWVPITKVSISGPDTFTAYTGIGPFKLRDMMRVVSRSDDSFEVHVEKIGPVLKGTASFKVRSFANNSSVVVWKESFSIPYLPKFLSPFLGFCTKYLFRRALKRLS